MTESTHPHLVTPRDGDTVHAGAASFEWESGGSNPNHHVQISASDHFDGLLVDTHVGSSTSLTLMGVLPQDGRRLYWRVSSQKGAWSEPAWFHASSPRRKAAPASPQADRMRTTLGLTAAAALPPDAPLYMTAVTGKGETVTVIVVLVALVTFLVLVLGF